MAYNLAGILGGALPLIVADPLLHTFGPMGIAFFLSALAVISTISLVLSRETSDQALDAKTLATTAS